MPHCVRGISQPSAIERPGRLNSAGYTGAAVAYAALIAALSQNSWKCVTLPFRNVNTIAKSESKLFLTGVVAV